LGGRHPEAALGTNPDAGKVRKGLAHKPEVEVFMKHALGSLSAIAVAIAVPAIAQGTPEAKCSASATQATGYTPGAATGPDGSRARGAARGAAAGAAGAAVQNNRYDNAPDALQDANRQDKARTGAAVGMAAAGSRNRQDRRQGRRAEDEWQKSYNACLAQQPK
jgi:hypothetical protein